MLLAVAVGAVVWLRSDRAYRPDSLAWRAVDRDLAARFPDLPSTTTAALADRLDAAEVQVEILSETSYEAVALVTALRLRDDSVRDERLRLTYAPYGDTWELVAAGRQVRCQPRRGVQEWHDGLCR